jgi:hypothetical protein
MEEALSKSKTPSKLKQFFVPGDYDIYYVGNKEKKADVLESSLSPT